MLCKICGSKTLKKHTNLFDNRHGYPGRFSLFKCTRCGFMQTQPQLDKKEISKIYSLYYPRKKISKNEVLKAKRNLLNKKEIRRKGLGATCHLKTRKGNKVLDVGSGIGTSLLEIESLGGEAWGIDPDSNAKRIASELNLKFHHGFLYDCPFPKKYFDLITLSQVLEHESDPIRLINECKKYLKPNGKIVLSVPNTDSFSRKILGKKWIHWHIPYHLNHFNKRSIKILVRNTGLRIKEMETITPNLWTLLQLLSFVTKSKEGKKSPVWVNQKGTGENKNEKRKSTGFFKKTINIIVNNLFFNRILDKLNLGESLVITLTRK